MRYLLGLLVLFSGSAWADEWTKADTMWQTSYTLLLAADCLQTRYGIEHPQQFHETNHLIAGGNNEPSKGRLYNICLATGLGHFGISYELPKGARRLWHASTVMIEVFTVANNKMAGIKIEF